MDLEPAVGAAGRRRLAVATHLDQIIVVDVRWYLDGRSGQDAYLAGHIPGAVWIDLDTVLAAPRPCVTAATHCRRPRTFAAGLGAAGIGDDDTVVAYDDSGGMAAGRLVWLLRIGGSQAALLDGGLAAWPGPLATGRRGAAPTARRFPQTWPRDRLASIDEISSVVAGRGPAPEVLVDARAPERYRGETEPVDPRAGHIPGAINLPSPPTSSPDGRFLPVDRAAGPVRPGRHRRGDRGDRLLRLGRDRLHDLLALEAAGLGWGRLYPGSWSQWSADRGRPAATGPEP